MPNHRQPRAAHRLAARASWILLVLLLAACASSPSPPADLLPASGTVPDWSLAGEAQVFDPETLFDLVDGQAECFFAYNFQRVTVQDYQNTTGDLLSIELWQMATPADAYGLSTASIAGVPATVGNDGDTDPGRRLAFWQDRFYVHVRARQEVPDADLTAFGQAVAAALPQDGERPALVEHLPPAGLVERSPIYFHQEISIQSELWLGGVNLLGLSPETEGVLARYDIDGVEAGLLLIRYPDAEAAAEALAALQGGQVDGVATADVRDRLLGAVIGEVETQAAGQLLATALDSG